MDFNFIFTSPVESIYNLLSKSNNLHLYDMEQKEIIVNYRGREYLVSYTINYDGIDTVIKAEVGDTILEIEPLEDGEADITMSGEQLYPDLVDQIAEAVLRELEN